MNNFYTDLLISLIVSILSFDFMYQGWKMLRQKRRTLLWPAKFIFSIVSLLFGREVAERRKEIFLQRAMFYEISALVGGSLGFIGGLLFLISTFQKIASQSF